MVLFSELEDEMLGIVFEATSAVVEMQLSCFGIGKFFYAETIL